MALSPDTLKAIGKYGRRVDGIARKKYGISGEALLAKLVKGESGDRMGAVSSAGARGKAQFIASTRNAVVKRYGIDPWRSTDEAVKAATIHLRGELGNAKGLEGYNPGDPNYPKYILAQKVGDVRGQSGARNGRPDPAAMKKVAAGRVKVTPVKATAGQESTDDTAALTDALLNRRKGETILKGYLRNVQSGVYTSRTEDKITPGKVTTTGPKVIRSKGGKPTIDLGKAAGKRGDLLEVFYQGPNGFNVKNGSRVPQGFVKGHTGHVHVAAKTRDQIVRLAKLAQKLGLRPGEHPDYGGVAPVHATNSNHYADRAIDVTGDAKRLAEYARIVARRYGVN